MRLARLVVPALAAAVALSSTLTASASSLLQLSSDPFTNTTSQHRTEVEPDTLSFGSTIVSAVQVGRFFNGGASDIGWATSTDGGKTWTNGFLQGVTNNTPVAGPYFRASDPSVAFDPSHNVWLISYLGINATGTRPVDVLVSRSTDGGLTWGNPVVVNADGDFNDKNWTVCDTTATSPFYGNCYTEFDDNTSHDLVQMSTSSDGGQTWSAGESTAQNLHGIGGQPLVQPGGTVIVPIIGFATRGGVIDSFMSTDGGATWSATTRVASILYHRPAGGIRAGLPAPSAEIDGSGKVFVVWPDCRFEAGCAANDLVFSTTADGVNWTTATRIPLDPIGSGVDHFIPGLAVNRSTSESTANLALGYYYYPVSACTASTCELNVGVSTSSDGGSSWAARTQLAGPMSLNWLPSTSQGVMVGDYMSTSFSSSGTAFPTFAVASAPRNGIFNEPLVTVRGGVSVATSGTLAAADKLAAPSNGFETVAELLQQ
jgi:hypothetical protein